MICNTCKLKNMCKVFDVINNNPGVNITINSCEYNNCASVAIKEVASSALETLKDYVPEEIENQRGFRFGQDFSELSRKHQLEKDKINNPINDIIDSEITDDELVECKCGNLSSAIINCPICDKQMCEACSMISVNEHTNATRLICEECWSTDKDKEVEKPKSKKRGRPKKKQEVINVM